MPFQNPNPKLELIISGFDTDIIKCYCQPSANESEENLLQEIKFVDKHAVDNVLKGRFEYMMRPCHSFPQMIKRLEKYRRRGFTLTRLTFEDNVSQEWREHILHEFRLKYAHLWWKEMVEEVGLSVDGNDLPLIVENNVLPYLGRFKGDDLSDICVFEAQQTQTGSRPGNPAKVINANSKKQQLSLEGC